MHQSINLTLFDQVIEFKSNLLKQNKVTAIQTATIKQEQSHTVRNAKY